MTVSWSRHRVPSSDPRFCDVDYVIEVPSSLPLAPVSNGDRGERHRTAASTSTPSDGGVELTRASGDVRVDGATATSRVVTSSADVVDVDTSHGHVEVELVARPAHRESRLEPRRRRRGRARTTVPPTASTAESERRRDDTPISTNPRQTCSITATTDHGDVTVRYPDRSRRGSPAPPPAPTGGSPTGRRRIAGSNRRAEIRTLSGMTIAIDASIAPRSLHPMPAAVRAEDATKVYGSGDTAVRALDGVTSTCRPGASPRSWARRARASRR